MRKIDKFVTNTRQEIQSIRQAYSEAFFASKETDELNELFEDMNERTAGILKNLSWLAESLEKFGNEVEKARK